jgi:hypothetical protein
MQKIDYTNKHGIMLGYIDRASNVCGIETGWNIKPEALSKLLLDRYPTKEDAITLVDSPIMVPVFKKDDYPGVEGFGDVIESNLSWNKEDMRKNVGHLFCHMTGVWKYSDNGIDWTPIEDEFIPSDFDADGKVFTGIRDALEHPGETA